MSEIERVAPIRAQISGPATRRRDTPRIGSAVRTSLFMAFSIA
jgi:hypothetical protein